MTSLRRSQRKKNQAYSAGDLVEILVKKVLHKGLLLSKSTEEGESWNVMLEGDDKERQMNEELFGRIVKIGQNTSSSTGKQQTKATQKPRGRPPKNKRGASITRKKSGNNEGSESNCTSSSIDRANDEKSHSLSTKSSKSRIKTTNKKSAGPGRRKKKVNVTTKVNVTVGTLPKKEKSVGVLKSEENGVEAETSGTTRVSTRSSSKKRNHADIASPLTFTRKPGTKGRPAGRGGKRIRKMKGEEVEKVKLLTGTLYLYRGENPRVAFVRHY